MYQDQPQSWIVEGRTVTTSQEGVDTLITYGLWFVDVVTGGITASDVLAQTVAGDSSCFKEP